MSIMVRDVSYTYMTGTPYERVAVKNISLTVDRGEFVGIIGHTGSGKSTLVQLIKGLLEPTQGHILVDNTPIDAKGEAARRAKRKVGMVFQYPEHQLFEETVYEDIAFGPRNMGLSADEVADRVHRAMAFVGLDQEKFGKRSPFRLSAGQMRRVAIAGVIALEPDYLILDEPSAGLDPRGRDEIFAEIVKLQQSTGIGVLLISHNMEEVARLVSRLIVLQHGEVLLDGTPRDIFSHHPDQLQQSGVAVPHVSRLLEKLRSRGLDVDKDVLTAEEATAAILKAVRGRGTC
jgi:energy-coupling factor transport system ATP-binding protein